MTKLSGWHTGTSISLYDLSHLKLLGKGGKGKEAAEGMGGGEPRAGQGELGMGEAGQGGQGRGVRGVGMAR